MNRKTLIPPLVCAVLCIILIQLGSFGFFFLVPLGFCASAYGAAAAWLCFLCGAAGNAVLALGITLVTKSQTGLASAGLDTLYFTVLAVGFTWIMAGNPPGSRWIPVMPRIRTVFRFIAASVAGALVMLGMIHVFDRNGDFSGYIRQAAEAISSAYIGTAGADAAQQSLLEHLLTPDKIIETLTVVLLRGGALASLFFIFFFSRQAAFILARLFRLPYKPGGDLMNFYAPGKTIWLLILCLPVILLSRIITLKYIEIAAWNILVICAIMFLAQGGGIILYTLARRPVPGIFRLLLGIVLVFLVFSPKVNVVALALLILLGISENWIPVRKKMELRMNE